MHRACALPPGLGLTGSVAGVWSEEAVPADARRTGARAAAAALGRDGGLSAEGEPRRRGRVPSPIRGRSPSAKGKDFVDFDEDLQTHDIVNTVKDGYDDIQLVKRYSTAGFGPSQGRHANLNTVRIVARETGRDIEQGRHDNLPAAPGAGEVRAHGRAWLRADAADRHASTATSSAAHG